MLRPTNLETRAWNGSRMAEALRRYVGNRTVRGVAICSVVPPATKQARQSLVSLFQVPVFELNASTMPDVGIDYPKPESIGPDRLANAIAARHAFGAPVVVVDFGTAVTFDVVDRRGNYVGGIIAPGLAAMTSYLHEKTALLPRIEIREIHHVVGKSTEQAMIIGAVHGYRGLIRELIARLKQELKCRRLPVVATGGYAELLARKLPEIDAVDALLTLKGLKRAWEWKHLPR
jgi:type III pantothenate kinase